MGDIQYISADNKIAWYILNGSSLNIQKTLSNTRKYILLWKSVRADQLI